MERMTPDDLAPPRAGCRDGFGVAVAIASYNHAHYLADALDSVMAQTVPAEEIIVVDDGSRDDPAAVVARYPGVTLVRQENQGLSGARNTALELARARCILFLDADDRLTPDAVGAGLACFRQHPEAGFVYGGHRRVDEALRAISETRYMAIGNAPHQDFLRCNPVGMHATVIYDREKLRATGGFARDLSRCEDYDIYLRMSRRHGVASHPGVAAEYRIHGRNMSGDSRDMLRWVQRVRDLDRERGLTDEERLAFDEGSRIWRDYYAEEILTNRSDNRAWKRAGNLMSAAKTSPTVTARRAIRAMRRRLPPRLTAPVLRMMGRRPHQIPLGSVRLGDLDSVTPVSSDFGWDRGSPVDRYYVERFLGDCAADFRGRALEIGDASYCERFGPAITDQDVLHVSADNPKATIVGDLSEPGTLPDATFDCMVLTQTLHLIYDLRAAVDRLHKALKPGGVLLLTVPGISQIDSGEWGETWYWSLTGQSARRLFGECFGAANVTVTVYGNVYAATCYINGLVQEEIDLGKLDAYDPAYPVIVAVRAQRAETE